MTPHFNSIAGGSGAGLFSCSGRGPCTATSQLDQDLRGLSLVAQTSSLLYRGFPIRQRKEPSKPCRLEVGDTAGWETCATLVAASPLGGVLRFGVLLLLLVFASISTRAAIQFDVFLGYDGILPEATWFPIVFEIKNDGPSFTGTVELTGENMNQSQARQMVVELPTGTLKRFVLPVFSTIRGFTGWDVRLLDERGKVRAEQLGVRPRKTIASRTVLIGSLPRTVTGAPMIRGIASPQPELQPTSARFQPPVFPDNPLVLEGMDCLYLNSEKASELKENQVNALLGWLNAGGHLIIGVEQITDVTSSGWLHGLVACELKDIQTVAHHPQLQEWLRTATIPTNQYYYNQTLRNNRRPRETVTSVVLSSNVFDVPDDLAFEAAELPVATGSLREGEVVVAVGDIPLIVRDQHGRGRVTTLLFSPEREPVRSWKNLPTFWARLTEVPGILYASSNPSYQAGWSPSSDGIFGAMIDSKQVHKLPIQWLLLLLIVYLVVIGPLDQFWLKRINKPMLTWVTFPCYVVLFSLLIYFIGYKLRAGESEWNELHLVDVLLNGEHAELRGRTYASVYAPSNQKYALQSAQRFATFRGEFLGGYMGNQSSEKATVLQVGDTFKAEVFIPVWTSQLFVSDWWQPAPLPLSVTVASQADGWRVTVENHTDQNLTNVQLVVESYIISLEGELPASQNRTFNVSKQKATRLREFVSAYGQTFQTAVQSRQHAFGATESGHITDLPNSTVAASFLSQMGPQQNSMGQFVTPPGLDLSPLVARGNAILFAWAGGYSPVKPMNQFSPRRTHRDTLWRMAVPVQ